MAAKTSSANRSYNQGRLDAWKAARVGREVSYTPPTAPELAAQYKLGYDRAATEIREMSRPLFG